MCDEPLHCGYVSDDYGYASTDGYCFSSVGTTINQLAYADDTVVFSSNETDMKAKLKWTETFCNYHADSIHPTKSHGISINIEPPPEKGVFNINDTSFDMNVTSFEYLGHIINTDLTTKEFVAKITNKCITPITNTLYTPLGCINLKLYNPCGCIIITKYPSQIHHTGVYNSSSRNYTKLG